MPEHWKQFTLYPRECRNAFQPRQVLHSFLPEWLADNPTITTWHVLFEPSALIRFISVEQDQVMTDAARVAGRCGLVFEAGDASADLNPGLAYPGAYYGGEAGVYGSELWDAAAHFLHACGRLSIEIAKLPHTSDDHRNQEFMMRKFFHVYGNSLGLNYLEEASLARAWAERSMELCLKHGRS